MQDECLHIRSSRRHGVYAKFRAGTHEHRDFYLACNNFTVFCLTRFVFLKVFVKLMRRYKYLEKMFLEEMKKVLMFIKGFTESERIKLARMTALWIANNSVQPQVLTVLINVCILVSDMYYFEASGHSN